MLTAYVVTSQWLEPKSTAVMKIIVFVIPLDRQQTFCTFNDGTIMPDAVVLPGVYII